MLDDPSEDRKKGKEAEPFEIKGAKNAFDAMTDAVLDETISTYAKALSEAIAEKKARHKSKLDIAYEDFESAKDRLAELGVFNRSLHSAIPFPFMTKKIFMS